jgi:AcrR family transcriptional regulator
MRKVWTGHSANATISTSEPAGWGSTFTMNATIEPRRQPSQERSKATVNRILHAAEALIAKNGTGALKMREIALRAKVPIGSVYMYFPNREAIIRAIVDQYHESIDTFLEKSAAEVRTAQDLVALLGRIVDDYYRFILSAPSILNLWSGSLYNKTLRELSIADSRRTAEILYRASESFLTPEQAKRALPCYLVCVDIIGSIAKLAVNLGSEEGDRAVEELRGMIVAHVATMLELDTTESALTPRRSRGRGE